MSERRLSKCVPEKPVKKSRIEIDDTFHKPCTGLDTIALRGAEMSEDER